MSAPTRSRSGTSVATAPSAQAGALVVGASGITGSALVHDMLMALAPQRSVEHVAPVTGLEHDLGPSEAAGQGDLPDTPFGEEAPRLLV